MSKNNKLNKVIDSTTDEYFVLMDDYFIHDEIGPHSMLTPLETLIDHFINVEGIKMYYITFFWGFPYKNFAEIKYYFLEEKLKIFLPDIQDIKVFKPFPHINRDSKDMKHLEERWKFEEWWFRKWFVKTARTLDKLQMRYKIITLDEVL